MCRRKYAKYLSCDVCSDLRYSDLRMVQTFDGAMNLFGIALHANLDRTVGLEFRHVILSHDGQGAEKPIAEVNTIQ